MIRFTLPSVRRPMPRGRGAFRAAAPVLLTALLAAWLAVWPPLPAPAGPGQAAPQPGDFAGSANCRDCHEKFYALWSTSFHGLAMRPYDDALAAAALTPQAQAMVIGDASYRMRVEPGQGVMEEIGGAGVQTYPIVQALGGKNVFYFLTPMQRGRLQTLPLAYDVRKKEWFDMAQSGVRHLPGGSAQAVHWKQWPYTFNTGCYGCHVSQLSTNYDPQTDSYRSTWTEPGINCETCHGPGQEHIRVCQEAGKGNVPKDMKLIRGGRSFTHEQQNASCASCHAKTVPLTASFGPGDRYFDHFDLVAYENPDYYPDGRDLGENYTMTSWSRSPCARSGRLDCMYCHTSSGRYKFRDEARANEACSPCHAGRVADAPRHTHHPEGSPGNRCISCHMPMTSFARMTRSDHSMLPPTPAATLAYGSPNACNLCHADKDAAWADAKVRQWRTRDYQAPVLAAAALIDAARNGRWGELSPMVEALTGDAVDPVAAASLLRLLRGCPDSRKWPAILHAAASTSPLVRAAAAEALAEAGPGPGVAALIDLTADDYRLVRVRAAASLTGLPRREVPEEKRAAFDAAQAEYLASLAVRPDLWTSQYNLGNAALARDDPARAVEFFEKAGRLDPDAVPPLVNLAIAEGRLGRPDKAEAALRRALVLAPDDAPAHFNLGLLLAQGNDAAQAEDHLRAALACDPALAEAAYNLGLLVSRRDPREATALARKAWRLRPDDPRYAYALALFLYRGGNGREALDVLGHVLETRPDYREAAALGAEIARTLRTGDGPRP